MKKQNPVFNTCKWISDSCDYNTSINFNKHNNIL